MKKKKEEEEKEFEVYKDLTWSNSHGRGSWYEAVEFARKCRDGGYNDWRLPTVLELQLGFDYEMGRPGAGGFACNFYWSATTQFGDTPYAWVTHLYNGTTTTATKVSTGYSYRCVRSSR